MTTPMDKRSIATLIAAKAVTNVTVHRVREPKQDGWTMSVETRQGNISVTTARGPVRQWVALDACVRFAEELGWVGKIIIEPTEGEQRRHQAGPVRSSKRSDHPRKTTKAK